MQSYLINMAYIPRRVWQCGALLLSLGVLCVLPYSALADSDASARGWAWGGSEATSDGVLNGDETGLGWVSMNSIGCDANEDGVSDGAPGCPAAGTVAAYGVDVPVGGGSLSGHAWSENVGWISFEASDLSGCPSGTCGAYRAGNAIRGWARILSPRTAGSNAGGFDGWVKLHSETGDPVPFGVTIDPSTTPAEVDGYAWSDEFGWLSMHDVTIESSNDLIICPQTSTITVAGTLQLTAYYRDTSPLISCGDLVGAIPITTDPGSTWSSADTGIASVSNAAADKGLLSGVAIGGPLSVTVSYGGSSTSMVAQVIAGPPCGDGIVDAGEACDEGSANNGSCATAVDADGDGQTCSATCQINICQCVI